MKSIDIYKGHSISFTVGLYWALGNSFPTVKAAKKAIDKIYE